MSLAQLPPLDFDTGSLRISLFPRSDSPPLIAPDPISGEPAVAEKSTAAAGASPTIPERKRPLARDAQAPHNTHNRDIGRDTSPVNKDVRPALGQEHSALIGTPQDAPTDRPDPSERQDNPFEDPPSETAELSDSGEGHEPTSSAQSIPNHPIASMQDAFAESLHEVTAGTAALKPKLRALNAKARREKLLEQDKDAEPFDQVWRYRPGQRQHEVLKLLAQISFGVYLLLNGLANSNSQVVTILQGHIDEVDEFLEVALEDLNQATIDLNGRIDYLKLPMSNMQVFEELLEDRNFRVEILEGNEKIEHILSRTNVALKQWDDDIEAGLACSAAFTQWLKEEDSASRTDRPEVLDIFDAMSGNAEGWLNAFDEMNTRAQEMNNLIIKLMTIVAEMEKKAGEISRKTWAKIPPFTIPTKSGDKSSVTSPHSNRSNPQSTPQGSIRSGTTTAVQAPSSDPPMDGESVLEYPLPGAAPLLPPPRISARVATRPSSSSSSARRQNVSFATRSPPQHLERAEVASQDSRSVADEEPLYILQPRTYTPQPAEPATSSSAQQSPKSIQSTRLTESSPGRDGLQNQTSLRQRVSQKGKPPVSIQIPPRNFAENRAAHRQSPSSATPRTGLTVSHESIYGSDGEPQPHYRQISRMASYSDLSPPVRPPLMPSPRSDHQYYRPVQASPHSPLQQRPHTSGTGAAATRHHHQSSYFTRQHVRNQPSRLGGMSTLSNVTNAQDDTRTIATQRTARGTERTLKKKKSAFGWLKKAFSMDDEERAAYEARKAMQVDPQYYDDQSPKFLDGKRIR